VLGRLGGSEAFTASADSKLECLLVGVLEYHIALCVIERHNLIVDDLSALLQLLLLDGLIQLRLVVVKVAVRTTTVNIE